MMTTKEFIEKLTEALEFSGETIIENTNLRSIKGYDSMSVMTIIAFVDEHFSKKLTARQLAAITTVRSLKELIGLEHFTD
jgi:acyl carrier protein